MNCLFPMPKEKPALGFFLSQKQKASNNSEKTNYTNINNPYTHALNITCQKEQDPHTNLEKHKNFLGRACKQNYIYSFNIYKTNEKADHLSPSNKITCVWKLIPHQTQCITHDIKAVKIIESQN